MLFYPRRRTTWPKKDAVPPGASLAYNLPSAHAPAAAWPHAAIVPPTQAAAAPPVHAASAPHVDQASASRVFAPVPPHMDTAIASHVAPAAQMITPVAVPPTPAEAPWDHAGPAGSDNAADVTTLASAASGPAALRRAILICGGQSALASAIGLTQSHVWNWLSRASIPAEHCPAIERATQRAVRCEQLRPDVDWAYLRAVCEELAEAGGQGAA
jgi:DNA-binding transcriptional regulator YdaS (Cro superfamily)